MLKVSLSMPVVIAIAIYYARLLYTADILILYFVKIHHFHESICAAMIF